MFAKYFTVIFLTVFLVFGQDTTEVLSDTVINTIDISQTLDTNMQEIQSNSEQKSDTAEAENNATTISLEETQKRVSNRRYIIVSSIMMMLFVGLAMGSVSAINPN